MRRPVTAHLGEEMIRARAMAARIARARMSRLAPRLTGGAGHVRELMVAVGRAADGMIVSWASDGTGAALEMEEQRWRRKGTCGACAPCGAWRCRAARRAQKQDDGDDQ
jgi:hypothetical protein